MISYSRLLTASTRYKLTLTKTTESLYAIGTSNDSVKLLSEVQKTIYFSAKKICLSRGKPSELHV